MGPKAAYKDLPFDEAIDFFKEKVKLPTERWTDLWEGMHSRAFVVAGAAKSELLSDMHSAVEKALKEGMTIQDFRKAFDETVARHGWSYKGGRGWRTGVIFETNLRTAYAAGHYKQMTEPAVAGVRPYWRYIGGLSADPRPEHLAWNGTVLPADDPWWNTHYPPNGWGCKCQVASMSAREMERDGFKVSEAPEVETRPWENPHTGEVIDVPKGIDPGWAYNPGRAAWGERLSEKAMSGWKAQGAKAWERLTPGDWKTNGRPEKMPLDKPKGRLDRGIPATAAGMETALRRLIGEEKVFSFQAGEFRHDVIVNAKKLASHMDPARAAYIPLLPETMEKPLEVWASFEKHKGTGQVVLRQRIIKAVETGEKEGMLVVTNAVNGVMEAWTMVPTSDEKYLNRQRTGRLIWKR